MFMGKSYQSYVEYCLLIFRYLGCRILGNKQPCLLSLRMSKLHHANEPVMLMITPSGLLRKIQNIMTDDLYFNKSWVNPNKIKKLNTD